MVLTRSQSAFSLVELSIVLVILGLLTGGILAGQSLIRAAELRAVSTEYQRWVTATQTFRDKYFALPGDISNAAAFWGTASVCPGASGDARSTPATCNGDGDGLIERNTATSNETFGFWQHLSNAGLIEGRFTGVTAHASVASSYTSIVDINVPRGKLGNSGWFTEYLPNQDVSSVEYIDTSYGNYLVFGANSPPASNERPIVAILRPEEAWNIDTKMDDGRAGTGMIVMREQFTSCYLLSNGTAGSMSTTVTRTDIQYNLATNSAACIMFFRNAF